MPDDESGKRVRAYQGEITADIEACVSQMGCQPILFVGSGLSKRYFAGPSWDELLTHLGKECPLIDKDYAYYKQTLKTQLAVGEEFAKLYQQWAWAKGKNQFPANMFSDAVPVQAYIKFMIAEYLTSITPADLLEIRDRSLSSEIAALQGIRPHAVITTNYDRFLELIFPEYQPVIGQSIIREAPVLLARYSKYMAACQIITIWHLRSRITMSSSKRRNILVRSS